MTAAQKKSLRELHPKRADIPLLIFASAALLAAGLSFPILTVKKLWEKNTFSVLTGIESLWNEKYYFLAAIIFFFSIVFPVLKLVSLFVLWFVRLRDDRRQWALHALSVLGKWSMLDVFVVALTIVAVKLGVLSTALPEVGIYYFGLSILLAMIVTSSQNNLAQLSKNSR